MGTLMQKAIARCGCYCGLIFLLALSPSDLHSSVLDDVKQGYLLKVSNTQAAAQLIHAVGGVVQEEVSSLNYLGTELTYEQLQLVSRSAVIKTISLHESGVAFDGNGGIAQLMAESGTELVAGKYWKWGRSSYGK